MDEFLDDPVTCRGCDKTWEPTPEENVHEEIRKPGQPTTGLCDTCWDKLGANLVAAVQQQS